MDSNPETSATTLDPARWVEDHGDHLFGLARFRVRNRTVAEDLVQETLLAALRSQDRFEGRSTERTWLTGILKNKIRDHLRRKDRETPATDVMPPDPGPEGLFDAIGHINVEFAPVDWGGDPVKFLERSEFRDVLRKCLGRMPSRTAEIFLARELQGDSTEELAARYEVTRNHLWVVLHRSRQMLRLCLENHWFTS